MHLRVVILADRDYPRPERVMDDLDRLFATEGLKVLTLVHGGASTGPDKVASQFCKVWQPWCMFRGRDVVQEVHEAPYGAYGADADRVRDLEMVTWGAAHLCLAYPAPATSRIADRIGEARRQGMEVWDRS